MNQASTSSPLRHRGFSLDRVIAMAGNTLIQLRRMKVFYFLLVFCAVLIGISFFFLRFAFDQELKMIKDVSLAAMTYFSGLFAIAGTAMLLPRDMEDRTLYTILSKPVPRFEYLLGKVVGVLALIAMSLVFMTVLFFLVLVIRQEMIIAEQLADLGERLTPERQKEIEAVVRSEGFHWGLWQGVWSIFLRSMVAASLTLLLSTFATSTLFTIFASTVLYFVGSIQHLLREFYFQSVQTTEVLQRALSFVVAIVVPDFHAFDIVDGVIAGEVLGIGPLGKISGLAVGYLSIYLFAAWMIFSKREL